MRSGRVSALRHRPIVLDVTLAVALSASTLVSLATGTPVGNLPPPPHRPADAGAVALLLMLTLPLAARRRFPIVVLALVTAASLGRILLDLQPVPGEIGVLVALHTASIHVSGRARLAVVGGCVTLLAAAMSWSIIVQGTAVERAAFRILLALLVVAAALTQRTLQFRAGRMAEDLVRAEREQEAAERELAAERGRLARELHDVVTHGVTAMIVQADAAQVHLRHDRTRLGEALDGISASGRSALAELRQLLAVIQPDPTAPLQPQPGLAGLPDLLRGAEAAGASISLAVQGRPRPVPCDVELSAFRIVQESVTNALQHGSPGRGSVVLRYGEDRLEIEVSNDGPGPASAGPEAGRPGRGLTGMRDRVALLGGRFAAGARPDGGYRVYALLPLTRTP